MKFAAATLLLLTSWSAIACEDKLPVKGIVNADTCAQQSPTCVPAAGAMFSYIDGHPDKRTDVLSVSLHGSPWHLYGADNRIISVEEMAESVRQYGSAIKRVELSSSWSGVAPDASSKSLAQRLSGALAGMPVTGESGFVWYTADGKSHTTRQAFTVAMGGQYLVPKNGKVMASLVFGALLSHEEAIIKARDGEAMAGLGVAADVYLLCRQKALRYFEASAAMGSALGAYNAAIMLLERGAKGDRETAITLLKQAAAAGDKPAAAKLRAVGA